jgi:Zn-dependent protease
MIDFKHLFDPEIILVTWPVFLFSLSFHECLHAWMADRLGDPTPRYLGRLTLNPLSHYDVIGTTFGLVFRTFGWAKPVPVNQAVFRWPKRDMMLTALGGPAINLALAFVFGVTFKVLFIAWPPVARAELSGTVRASIELVERMAAYGCFLNLVLAVFNLLPLYPLDGHHILRGFLSYRAALAYDRTKHIGGYLLLGLIVMSFAGFGGLRMLIGTPINAIMDVAFSEAELTRLWNDVLIPLLWPA